MAWPETVLAIEKLIHALAIAREFGVVADIADHVAVLQRGALVESGTRAEVLERPSHPYTQALIAAVPKLLVPSRPRQTFGKVMLESIEARKAYQAHGMFGRGRATVALDGVSVTLRRGETLGLVGESGSGKSTLARAMTRLLTIDSGDIVLDGDDITRIPARLMRTHRQKIQMIFQDPYASLDPRQRVADIKTKLQLSKLFVTHDLRVALQICDRIAVMRHGAIVELDETATIHAAPKHPYTRALFDAVPGAAWSHAMATAAS